MVADLTWNRTVNLKGGLGKNLEPDIVNEFLNNQFKDGLGNTGGQYSDNTIARYSQLASSLGDLLDAAYNASVAESSSFTKTSSGTIDRHDDIVKFVKLLKDENLFEVIPGRQHRSFPKFTHQEGVLNPAKYRAKLLYLSKRLDFCKRVRQNNQ